MEKFKAICRAIFTAPHLAHFGGFGLIALFISSIIVRLYGLAEGACFWLPALGTISLGALIQFVKAVRPGNSFDWKRLVADGLGVVIALIILTIFVA